MTAQSIRSNRAGLGISITVIGGLCFSIQDAGIKWLTIEVEVLQVLFLRSLFGLLFLVGSTRLTGEKISLRVDRPWLLLLRTATNILGWVLFFYSLKYLPLAIAVALFFSFPLFLAIISVPLLGETVGLRRVMAIVVGFIGVLLITNPTAGISLPALLMLGAALCWAFVASLTRILGERENASTMLFYTLLAFALVLAMPQYWLWGALDTNQYLLVAVVAFFGVIAQFSVTKAYAIAAPSLIAAFEYTALIWSAIIGYLVWGDIPDAFAVTGAVLIIASGIYVIHREALNNGA
ncbi:MAG: DMT family transporter [Gammaproteobacteria bacterium]|nr:DMT family transporter [Gammaproteobacteria bacterium]MDH3447780.1 DMT family transporter [Gammaproteobacteria bacterium]